MIDFRNWICLLYCKRLSKSTPRYLYSLRSSSSSELIKRSRVYYEGQMVYGEKKAFTFLTKLLLIVNLFRQHHQQHQQCIGMLSKYR